MSKGNLVDSYVLKRNRRQFIEKHFFQWSFDKHDDYIPEKALFLQLTHPMELHYLANIYNCDDGELVLEWILESPLCTRSTTTLLFWRTCPDYYLEFDIEDEQGSGDDCNSDSFKFLRKIIQKYKNNSFSSYQIEFDPKGEIEEITTENAKWSYPKGVYDKISGNRLIVKDYSLLGWLIDSLLYRFTTRPQQ
jgi:hypothetical protein